MSTADLDKEGLFTVDLSSDKGESVEFDITARRSPYHGRSAPTAGESGPSQQLMAEDTDTADGDLGSGPGLGLSGATSTASASSTYASINSGSHENGEGNETYTIEEAIEHLGLGKYQMRVSCIAGLAWTADAVEMMVLSILSPALSCDWGLPTWQLGLITSVVFIGMMIGSSFWGYVSDKYGRKFALVLAGVFCLYFGLMSAMALSLIWMLVFRCLVGFGVAGGSQAVTLYSEFLPQKARAKSIVAIELFWVVGSGFSALLAYFVMPVMGWRWLLIYSAVPLMLFCLACVWLPESMRFNLSRGHVNAAKKTLQECAAMNNKTMLKGRLLPPPKQTRRGRVGDLFTVDLRMTTLLLWFIWFANTFCYYGIVLVTTELLGIQDNNICDAIKEGHIEEPECVLDCTPLLPSNYLELLWTTAAELPGLALTFFIVDIIGRKWSAGAQFVLFAISTGLVAVCKGRYFMIFWLFAARCFISGAFQVAFVYTPEIYPTNCRALGLGVCSSLARIGAVVTPFVAQVLLQHSIYSAIGIYAGVAALAGVCCLLLPIETKGKNLQESHTMSQLAADTASSS